METDKELRDTDQAAHIDALYKMLERCKKELARCKAEREQVF